MSDTGRCDDCGEQRQWKKYDGELGNEENEDLYLRRCQFCKQNICDMCDGGLNCEGEGCSNMNCIDCIEETDDAYTLDYVKYCTNCETAYCARCRPWDCHIKCSGEDDGDLFECMPSWFGAIMSIAAKKRFSFNIESLWTFWDNIVHEFSSDKDFDISSYGMLVQSRAVAYALALHSFKLGKNNESVYYLFYAALMEEIEGRGPDYTILLLRKKMSVTQAFLVLFFPSIFIVGHRTSTRRDLYKYLINMKRHDKWANAPLLAQFRYIRDIPKPEECNLSDEQIHSLPSLFRTYEGQVDRTTGDSQMIDIKISDMDEKEDTLETPYNDAMLGWFLKIYAIKCNYKAGHFDATPAKYFRVIHKGKTLFLSSAGKKTLVQLEIEHNDQIIIGGVIHEEDDNTKQTAKKKPSKTGSKKGKKKNQGGKKKKKQHAPIIHLSEEQLMEKYRQEHSKAMTPVFEELDPKLRDIRNALNALTLEKSAPKVKKSKKKKKGNTESHQPLLPQEDTLGGKAGKIAYPILVGEISNLYKTFKSSASSPFVIDLHGLSQGEALNKLEESLPTWVETAMKGEYPWVIAVDIICGGGNQILSEVVGEWIKANRQVANRPKAS